MAMRLTPSSIFPPIDSRFLTFNGTAGSYALRAYESGTVLDGPNGECSAREAEELMWKQPNLDPPQGYTWVKSGNR